METLKKLWKNEYFQTLVTVALIVVVVMGVWFGSQQALNSPYPALAVASGSMLPTLEVGDLIIVQGVPPEQIHAAYLEGDILVFRNPNSPDDLIVHRAIAKENRSDGYYFTTHGDNNGINSNEGPFHQRYVVGKVIAKVPYVGNFALFMHTRENFYLFIIVLFILFVVFIVVPFGSHGKGEANVKRILFGKVSYDLLYFMIINLLLVAFIVFNLWGSYAVWQPGSKPPQYVTIRGMFLEPSYYESFKASYNRVSEATLSHGFLTYAVNCNVSDSIHTGVRPGVLTVSMAQLGIVGLVVFDVWTAVRFLKARKNETPSTQNSVMQE
ncbi:MAG: signal peptidase I [Candidatus Bathyarchaeia archaeon]